jgi:cytochrome c
MTNRTLLIAAAGMMIAVGSAHAADVDASAAEALAKKSGCFKCHAVDKKKDGPSFKETAAKYKGKADAVDKITKHVTTNPKIKVDGVEETHDALKSKDAKEIRNVVDWILSR